MIEPQNPQGQQPPDASQGAPDAAQAPPPPLPLDEGPFAPQIAADGTQVAGKGAVLRPLLKKLFGGRAPGPGDAGEAAEDAIASGLEQDVVTKARTAPTMTPGPKGPFPGQAEAVTGTTRPLPNVDYFESQETKQVLTMLERHAQTKAAGPVTPHAQTRELAESRQTLLNITGKPVDLGWSPQDLLALRNSLEGQAKELDAMASGLRLKQANGMAPSAAELAQFELASQRLVATNNAVAGLSTQAGQLLNSLQIPATDTGLQVRALASVVEAGGGAEAIAEKIGLVAKAGGDVSKINQAVNDSFRQKAWDALLRLRYNMMLASVRTHGANIAGSALTGAWEQAVINPLAWAVNRAERAGRRVVGGPDVVPGDIVAPPYTGELRGLVKGARDGLSLAWDIARGAEVPAESWGGKFIQESGLRYRAQDQAASIPGKVVNTPTRLLEAEDAFFRSTYYNARLEGLARSRAAGAGSPEDVEAAYRSLIDNPPADMRAEAKEYSQKLTFTNEPEIYGKLLGSMAKAGATLQESGPFHLLLPFVRTPANLLGYSLEAGGMAPLVAPLKTYQALRGSPRERAEAIARTTAGAGLMMLLYDYWAEGKITGIGSSNYQAVRLMESTGWRSNSLKVGDTYYELNRLDPMGFTFAMASSAFEIWNERNMSDADKMVATGGILLQMGDLMMDRSYMSGLGDLVDAMKSGEGGTKRFGALLVSSTGTSFAVPNVLRDFREGSDEFRREQAWELNQPGAGLGTRFMKNFYNALPGYSKKLPVALDWRGQPITNDAHYLFRAMVPVRASQASDPPPSTMALIENAVFPRKPRTVMTIPGGGRVLSVPLLSEQAFGEVGPSGHLYSYYQQLIGQARERRVQKVISGSAYRRAMADGNGGDPDSPAGKMLDRALDVAVDEAKIQLKDDLSRGAEVTLYPGSGAEVKVQLPKVDTREWDFAMRDYMRATPEERESFEPPAGLQRTPRKVTPRF